VPRPCDIFSIAQAAKFELVEMDDTVTNREKVLVDLIKKSLAETALEYVKGTDPAILDKIKQEFVGKSFQVSQKIMAVNSMQTSYENQLRNFETIKTLVKTITDRVYEEHQEFGKKTSQYGIKSELLLPYDQTSAELRAAVTEIILEGLCWTEPKTLDKKETEYVAA
jgi:magnesium chelatase subunit I